MNRKKEWQRKRKRERGGSNLHLHKSVDRESSGKMFFGPGEGGRWQETDGNREEEKREEKGRDKERDGEN